MDTNQCSTEQKRIVNVGTGTIAVYYERGDHPYIEIQEGYNGEPKGLYLEYDECVDELIKALTLCKK